MQRKHHRWKLDRGQIQRYRLADRLDPNKVWWENIDISDRSCNFFAFHRSASLTSLVCEDLARIDPVQRAIRSVGPNLVVVLLMDGIQVESRWSARYATVLADDPGCSVLTLSSVGMIRRSDPALVVAPMPVGLWKEPGQATIELRLPSDADALLLNLSVGRRAEWTLDGRKDEGRGGGALLSLSGLFPIAADDRPQWVGR
jgi:hypothetical protein